MPVPSAITDLSATAASNSPSGSEAPSVLDDHQRTLGAFIRQLYDVVCNAGGGTLSLNFGTAAINFCNGQFYKDASGNFGFGTSAPAQKIHLKSAGGFVAIALENSGGAGGVISYSGPDLLLYAASGEKLRAKGTGQCRFYPLSSAPSGAEEGDIYYDSTTKKHYGYNGTAWQAFY